MDFFESYETWKTVEDWNSIINDGNKILEENLGADDNALVNCRIASSLFYLGQYKAALESANYAFGNASLVENKELEARSLYLLSASNRALGEKAEALFYINKVTPYIEGIDNLTKIKIWFNKGAIYQDLEHDYIKAKENYKQALDICAIERYKDDCNRVAIRSIRATLELGDALQANKEAKMLTISLDSKTGVQFLLLKSKIAYALGDLQAAHDYASQGLSIANSKQMHKEIQILNDIIQGEKLCKLLN